LLFRRKEFAPLAELVDLLHKDAALRQRIIAGQSRHVRSFLAEQVRPLWDGYLDAAVAASASGTPHAGDR
jgi:hypothetical protein